MRDGGRIYSDNYLILVWCNSYLDRFGEIRIIWGFVDNGFETGSVIEKVLVFGT